MRAEVIPSEVKAATQLPKAFGARPGFQSRGVTDALFNGILRLRFALLRMTPDEAHASITTGVSSSTNSNSSITSALRIRTQPWLAGVPILSSCLVP